MFVIDFSDKPMKMAKNVDGFSAYTFQLILWPKYTCRESMRGVWQLCHSGGLSQLMDGARNRTRIQLYRPVEKKFI